MTESEGWKDKNARELFAYERLMARGLQTNSMQWQVPSLALAAQAFLLTIALREDIAPLAATIVCLVGLLITVMAMQLMARHRWYFHLDRLDMRDLEKALDLLCAFPTGRAKRLGIPARDRLGSAICRVSGSGRSAFLSLLS
jgi:hypothetical protein